MNLHHVDHGGSRDGPLLVLVHGLGGSLLNWMSLVPLLTPVCRVVAVDLPGFGRSPADGDTSVAATREALHEFLARLGEPVVLVGNSMGGQVAALEAAAEPQSVRALALIDPVLPFPRGARSHRLVQAGFAAYGLPGLGPALLRGRRAVRTPEQLARDTLWLCCADPGRVAREVLDQHVELLLERRDLPDAHIADRQFLAAARSLLAAVRTPESYVRALRAIAVPVLLLHGDRDRLVPVAAARAAAAANPRWTYAEAHGVGHVPQLEAPDWTARQLLDWLGSAVGPAGLGPRGAGSRPGG
ncbi:MAG TPA: alpha/beta fold hydrolase [Dermatophilaceae bacterium]|nr:alpha/beta fold hydrolase [Dermatophilaceae bacterium]